MRTDRPEAVAAVARDASTAERWQAALATHGIEAAIRIEDAAVFGDRSSVQLGVNRLPEGLFVYAVVVPADALESARTRLAQAGWDGRLGARSQQRWSPRAFAVGIAATFGVSAALIALAVLRAS